MGYWVGHICCLDAEFNPDLETDSHLAAQGIPFQYFQKDYYSAEFTRPRYWSLSCTTSIQSSFQVLTAVTMKMAAFW
jgi:hypothetical protein